MHEVNLLFFNNANGRDTSDANALDTLISAVDSSLRVTNQSALIIDFDEHRLLYRTRNLLFVDEATPVDSSRGCANPYWTLVSEDTLKHLLHIRNNYLIQVETLSEEEYRSHICIIDYPIAIRSHQLFITQKFTPLVIRGDGITKIGLFIITNSNKESIEGSLPNIRG